MAPDTSRIIGICREVVCARPKVIPLENYNWKSLRYCRSLRLTCGNSGLLEFVQEAVTVSVVGVTNHSFLQCSPPKITRFRRTPVSSIKCHEFRKVFLAHYNMLIDIDKIHSKPNDGNNSNNMNVNKVTRYKLAFRWAANTWAGTHTWQCDSSYHKQKWQDKLRVWLDFWIHHLKIEERNWFSR